MEDVSIHDLSSYRSPTQEEHRLVTRHMDKKLRMELRPIRVWLAICIFGAVAGILNLFLPEVNRSPLGWVVSIAAAVFIVYVVFALNRAKNNASNLIKELNMGKYQVLDCTAYEIKFQAELSDCAEAKIQCSDGRHCSEKLLLDFKSAKKCKDNPDTKLLLMKYGDRYSLLESEDTTK